MTTKNYNLEVSGVGAVVLTVNEYGEGQPFLILHGGGGPQTVAGFAAKLAEAKQAHVIVPVHPGFGGTGRSEKLTTIKDLAALYIMLLDALEINDVTVIGNSIGGWIAAEMSLMDTDRISSIILVDAVGIEVPNHPVVDIFTITLDELAKLSYYDPVKFAIDPSKLPPAIQAQMPQNRASLKIYNGEKPGVDPSLKNRLSGVQVPTLVLWGESDKIVDPDYGKEYAKAIPTAQFKLLKKTGHLPQLEVPEELLEQVWEFSTTNKR